MATDTPNLDGDERDRFATLAAQWWDADGPLRTLHDINPCRLEYIAAACPLDGRRVADIGCGGGLLSTALAARGAQVTAIDAAPELIEVARAHGKAHGLDIDYRAELCAALATREPRAFDLVVCMELVEHVPDVDALIGDCAQLLRDGGELVVSTLNRTPAAYVTAILGAEYVLGLLPRGTHDYERFLRPAELARCARRHGLELLDVSGMRYNPITRRARLGGAPRVNYLARLRRGDPAPR